MINHCLKSLYTFLLLVYFTCQVRYLSFKNRSQEKNDFLIGKIVGFLECRTGSIGILFPIGFFKNQIFILKSNRNS